MSFVRNSFRALSVAFIFYTGFCIYMQNTFSHKHSSTRVAVQQGAQEFETFSMDKLVLKDKNLSTGTSLVGFQGKFQRVIRILFWNSWLKSKYYGFGFGRNVFNEKCGTNRCEAISSRIRFNEADAVVFFAAKLRYAHKPIVPRRSDPEQVFVFLNTESPVDYPTSLLRIKQTFNVTISYRSDSTIWWPRGKVIPRETDYDSVKESQLVIKNKTVAWITPRCDHRNIGRTYYEQLNKYIQVDVYGKCGELKCPERGQNITECIKYLSKSYKFYLAFENSHCVDYITETAFRALQYGIIPIVMGGANYTEYFPPKSFINVKDFKSPKHLAEYLIYLNNNPDEYLKYFEWRSLYTIQFPTGVEMTCQLCFLLTNRTKLHLDYDISAWWEKDTCIDDSSKLADIYHVNE